jgi:hypothetical protein
MLKDNRILSLNKLRISKNLGEYLVHQKSPPNSGKILVMRYLGL